MPGGTIALLLWAGAVFSQAQSPLPSLDFSRDPARIRELCGAALARASERLGQASPESLAEISSLLDDLKTETASQSLLALGGDTAASDCVLQVEEFDLRALEKIPSIDLTGASPQASALEKKNDLLSKLFIKNVMKCGKHVPLEDSDLAAIEPSIRKMLKQERFVHLPSQLELILSHSSSPRLRERLKRLSGTLCAENSQVLKDLLLNRLQLAKLLDAPSYAHLTAQRHKLPNPEKAVKLLERLMETAALSLASETVTIQTLKFKVEGDTRPIASWDLPYYLQLRRDEFLRDSKPAPPIFPVRETLAAMLDLAGEIFSLRFERGQADARLPPGLELYSVYEKEGGAALASIYFDVSLTQNHQSIPEPRQIISRRGERSGLYYSSLSAQNGMEGASDGLDPEGIEIAVQSIGYMISLMYEDDTRNLYFSKKWNEPRHFVIQRILKMATSHPKILRRLATASGSLDESQEKALGQMLTQRPPDAARNLLMQTFHALVDLAYHLERPLNPASAYEKLYERILTMKNPPGTDFSTLFVHPIRSGGFFFGFLWYDIAAADITSRIIDGSGRVDKIEAAKFSTLFLKNTESAKHPNLFIREYLGREPRIEPLLATIHRDFGRPP